MKVFLPAGSMKESLSKFPSVSALAVGLSLLSAACATAPGNEAASVGTGTNGQVAQTDKLICHSEKRTGTNFPTRICKTAEQWNEVDRKQRADAYDYTRQVFENGAVTNAKNNGQCATCNMKE